MTGLFFLLLLGLELKHFIADYLLQPGWMLAGKGDFRRIGGYAHAGVHTAMSAVIVLVAGTPLAMLALLLLGEFVIHYLLDWSKIRYSRGVHVDTSPQRFWALHGADQLAHQFTYAAIIYGVVLAKGLA